MRKKSLFEGIKWAIRCRQSKPTGNTTAKIKRTKEQTIIYKTLLKAQKIAEHESHKKPSHDYWEW